MRHIDTMVDQFTIGSMVLPNIAKPTYFSNASTLILLKTDVK